MDLDEYRRGQGIEIEKLDRFGDGILHPPASGVVAGDQFRWRIEVIGDDEGGLFMTITAKDNLPKFVIIVLQEFV